MIAPEQPVDGMDLDEAWCQEHLAGTDSAVAALVMDRIRSKSQRLDVFRGHKITCYVKDQDEAILVRLIHGPD